MTRSLGVVESLTALLPEWSVVLLGLLTQLGDAWFVALLLAASYWRFRERRASVAAIAGATLLAVGAYRTLKHLFERPRPPEPLAATVEFEGVAGALVDATATAGGYGFPSGHATTATAVYVGLAAVLPLWTARRRYGVAAALAGLVAATRVFLGVHYLVDVVAGVALGLAVVAASLRIARRDGEPDPTPVFVAAVVASLTYAAASGGARQSFVLLALALAALAAWRLDLRRRATDALGLEQ